MGMENLKINENLIKNNPKNNEQKFAVVTGKNKTAKAVARISAGEGRIIVNKRPLDLFSIPALKAKLYEPINVAGANYFAEFDISITVKGGGSVSQVYAVRMAIARALVAYYHKYVDEREVWRKRRAAQIQKE